MAGKSARKRDLVAYDLTVPRFYWDAWFDTKEEDRRAIGADPFGSMAGNGIPGLLVWKKIKNWTILPAKVQPPGAFLSAWDRDSNSRVVPLVDAEHVRIQWQKDGFKNLWLIWQVPIEGRRREGIRKQLEEIWNQVLHLKA